MFSVLTLSIMSVVHAGAGAILSVGLLKSIPWENVVKDFQTEGGVSGGETTVCPQEPIAPTHSNGSQSCHV